MRTLLVFSFLLCIILLKCLAENADEHAERIHSLLKRKVAHSMQINDHAENLIAEHQKKNEDHVASIKTRKASMLEGFQKIERFNDNSQELQSIGIDASQKKRLDATLSSHGVPPSLVNEINNMASARVPREQIVEHVKTHFPSKKENDWNDIVVAAVGSRGKLQPEGQDFVKATRSEVAFDAERFKRAKDSLERLKAANARIQS